MKDACFLTRFIKIVLHFQSDFSILFFYLVNSFVFDADADRGGLLEDGVDLGVEKVEPARLVGILVGVPSSLTRERVDPCREAGRDVLGVRLDRMGIEVLVVSVLVGVGRPKEVESE